MALTHRDRRDTQRAAEKIAFPGQLYVQSPAEHSASSAPRRLIVSKRKFTAEAQRTQRLRRGIQKLFARNPSVHCVLRDDFVSETRRARRIPLLGQGIEIQRAAEAQFEVFAGLVIILVHRTLNSVAVVEYVQGLN